MIDFSSLALSPNESRAARNFLGLSQAQTAEASGLPVHKLKRFESGNYVPDAQFLQDLRSFYEGQGFDFHDESSPGAKAKAKGDVFPAGVVGATDDDGREETAGSASGALGKLPRPQTAQLQYMRIAPTLQGDQIDRIFDCIEGNETAILDGSDEAVQTGFLFDGPSASSQASAVSLLRRLAENGLLYAQLMGRELLPPFVAGDAPKANAVKTIGDLLRLAMSDLQLAVVQGDKEAQNRRKARTDAPTEVLQALIA